MDQGDSDVAATQHFFGEFADDLCELKLKERAADFLHGAIGVAEHSLESFGKVALEHVADRAGDGQSHRLRDGFPHGKGLSGPVGSGGKHGRLAQFCDVYYFAKPQVCDVSCRGDSCGCRRIERQ